MMQEVQYFPISNWVVSDPGIEPDFPEKPRIIGKSGGNKRETAKEKL